MTEEIKSLSEEIVETTEETVETIEETTEKKDDKLKLDYGKERKLKKGTKVKESWQYNVFRVFNVILMSIICILTLYPFLYLVAQSFSSEAAIIKGQVTIFPVGFNFTTYKSVITKGEFLGYYKNTILYAVFGTFFSVLFSAMLAYPLSKPQLRLNKFFVPFIIFTMYFGGGLIPNYILMTSLGLRNTIFSFILPGLIGTYYVLLMKSFFASFPHELEEAGEIDGLSKYGVFFRIVLPNSKPIIATMVLFYMAGYWSNWFNAFLYLEDRSKWPVAYHLRQIIIGAATSADPGAASLENMQIASNIKSCSMVLMAVPIICVYPFIQKYFVQGMMLGGVKG